MKKIVLIFSLIVLVGILALLVYGYMGWRDGANDAPILKMRAQRIIAAGRGPESLGAKRLEALLKVQDPGFYTHSGVDLSTPGAGLTTLVQSLAKRLAFEEFAPGIGKIRQTTYALSIGRHLSKPEQIALFLETAQMGEGDNGWVTGFHEASDVFFGTSPDKITDQEFFTLVAVLISPGRLKAAKPDGRLESRVARISRLVAGECEPESHGDVWLEGCRVD